MGRKILQLCLLFAAMVLIAFGVSWLFSKQPPTPSAFRPLPNPNGYPLLVSAGSTLPMPTKDFRRMNPQELRALVDGGSNALQLARTALTMECQVPLEPSDAYRSNHIRADLTAMRRMAQTLAAEGRLAELENRTNDAVGCYLDVARLGAKSARGGNVMDAMIGSAIESMSREALRPLRDDLDAKSCREIAASLEAVDAQRESWQQVLDNDPDWTRRSQASSLRSRLIGLVRSRSNTQSLKDVERNYHAQSAMMRRTMLEFAARAYELEHHQKAVGFADLIPAYLKTIPQDSLTGTNMVFTP